MSAIKDGLQELVDAAAVPAPELPSFNEVIQKAKQAAALARQAVGPLTPVDSGVKMHPRLRISAKKPGT